MSVPPQQQPPDSKPNPDPTVATNEAVERAMKSERDFVLGQVAVLVQRMNDRDEATKVLHETVTRVPTDMQLAVGHLRDVMQEKFVSVQTQFAERDERAVRESTANTVAVNAAFAAQKEAAAEQNKSNTLAINKSEDATKEAIGKLAELVKTGMDALADKIDDGKDRSSRIEDRLTRAETEARAKVEQRVETRDTGRYAMTAAASLFGAILFLIALYAAFQGNGSP